MSDLIDRAALRADIEHNRYAESAIITLEDRGWDDAIRHCLTLVDDAAPAAEPVPLTLDAAHWNPRSSKAMSALWARTDAAGRQLLTDLVTEMRDALNVQFPDYGDAEPNQRAALASPDKGEPPK